MKTGKLFLSIAAVTFFAPVVHAQFDMPGIKDANDIKNRQLIVEVTGLDDKLVDKIEKKQADLQDEYKKVVNYYNSNMKAAAEKFWNFNSKTVLYKTAEEIKEIDKDKTQRDNYVVMYCHSFKVKDDIKLEIYEENKGKYRLGGPLTYFALSYTNQSPIIEEMLSTEVPSAREVAWAVSTTNYNLNYVYNHKKNCDMKDMIDENAPMLKNKTLLIVKGEVSSTVIDDIAKYYPGKVKLVEFKDMIRAIGTADSTSAYVIWTEYNTNNGAGTDWIINCADGATLAHRRTGLNMSLSADQGYKKDFFQEMAKFYNAGKK